MSDDQQRQRLAAAAAGMVARYAAGEAAEMAVVIVTREGMRSVFGASGAPGQLALLGAIQCVGQDVKDALVADVIDPPAQEDWA